ncbi:hypothetical protein AcW1_008460 [Taiwanofungus camphoratus]|nr:hypothetical protein AcW1_008460 [Antrodia cinnamomea]
MRRVSRNLAELRLITVSEDVPVPCVPLRDQTNRMRLAGHYLTSPPTPDTGNTFGVTDYCTPAMSKSIPKDAAPPEASLLHTVMTSAKSEAQQRQARYRRAHEALEVTFRHCISEPSPVDLQSRALERAATLLSMQACDAQRNADELRARLAHREAIEPQDFRSLQREYWMEVRRSTAREQQSKALQEVSKTLANSQRNPFHTTDAGFISRSQSLRSTNLACFFERSPTWLSFTRRAPTSAYQVMSYRRKTIHHVRSMRLRPSLRIYNLSQSEVAASGRDIDAHHRQQVQSDGDGLNEHTSEGLTGSRPSLLKSPGPLAVLSEATPGVQVPLERRPPSAGPSQESQGTVSIYMSSAPRSRAEIMADLDEVPIPDYATHLLDELISNSLDVSLRSSRSLRRSHLPRSEVISSFMAPASANELKHPTQSANTAAHARSQSSPHSHSRLFPTQALFRRAERSSKRSSWQRTSSSLSSVAETLVAADEIPRSRPNSSIGGLFANDNGSSPQSRFPVSYSFKRENGVVTRVKNKLSVLGRR